MREDIAFNAEGTTLRGWLYTPETGTRPFPTVVIPTSFTAVKEMGLDSLAEVFARGGLAALVFDNRNLGASDGEPRQEVDPWAQVRDCRHAITYARARPEVDRDRIGVWGVSYSGGHVMVLGAIDRRIRCVVSQVPLCSGYRNALRLVRADFMAHMRNQFDQDREARFAGQPPAMIPLVSADPAGPAALPTADAYQWFTETAKTKAPAWKNEITLRSAEMMMEYEPASYIERISPTPFLMIIAAQDHDCVADEAFTAFNQAREPKKLVILPGGHFDTLGGPDFEMASKAACDWFVEHLAAKVPSQVLATP
jgi:fermentation-respiration switch protein FrsA (DUF1100 family)